MTATAWKTKNPPGELESIYLLLSDLDGNILFASTATKEKFKLLRRNTSSIHLSEVLFGNDRIKMQSALASVLGDLRETKIWLDSAESQGVRSKRCWFFYPLITENSGSASCILCVSSIHYDEVFENLIKHSGMKEEPVEVLLGKPLREPAYFLDLVLNHSYNCFILLDTNLRVVFFNKVAAEYYRNGFGKELYAGLDFFETIHEDLKESRRKLFNEKILKGEVAEVIGKIPSDDGNRILLNTYFPIYNEKSVVSGVGLISTDITERERVKDDLIKSEQFFKSLISDSLDGICLTDTQGKISYVAPSCKKVLGFEPSELIGKNCFDLVHPDDQVIAKSGFQDEVMKNPKAKFYEIRLKNSQDQWIWMLVRAHNMLDNAAVNSIVIFFSDLTIKKEADFARKEAEQKARQNSVQIANILHSITDGFVAFDRQFNVILWNHVSESITGIPASEILNQNIWSKFPDYINSRIFYEYKMAMELNTTVNFTEYMSRLEKWFEFSVYPSVDGLFVYFKDITRKKQQEMVLDLERQVFEMNSKVSATLKNTVDFFLIGIEKIFPGMICSVHRTDDSGEHLLYFSGPTLPKKYLGLVGDLKIGPKIGSCGTAAYRKETVVVTDTQDDELWEDYKEIAQEFGLRACWSVPILNHDGNVLATFAIYYSVVKTPTEDEIEIITKFAGILGILLEKENAEEKLRISNERYKFVTRATNEAIWDWDLRTNEIYWGDGFRILFGHNLKRGRGDYKLWLKCVHPADRKRVDKIYYGKNLRDLTSNTIEAEYRFLRSDGTYAQVVDRGYLIFDDNGDAIRMVGSMRDITEYKKLQAHVLQEELNRHKLVVEATIGAQEKERAEIGKELHDNINQILSTTKLYIELARSEEGRRVELLQMSSKNINYAINEIRNLSHSLVPPSLKDLGLVESIFDIIGKIRMTQSFNIDFDFSDLSLESQITLDQKLTLYRIVQEQLNNIIKHANARNVSIELSISDGFIRLLIVDDGSGFDAERARKGVGLNNIFNRAEFHQGTAELDTMPGHGCKLLVVIPDARIVQA